LEGKITGGTAQMGAEAIVIWIVGLVLLYLMIKWAIDGSETAENIRQIRKILSKQFTDKIPETAQTKDTYEILDISVDECPACHTKVSQKDTECPSCGLSLKNIKE
jgi:hypothetical protein